MSQPIVCPLKMIGAQGAPQDCLCSPHCAWFTGPEDAHIPDIRHGHCALLSIATSLRRLANK